ncbi:MAG: hypothetical protein ACI8W8_004599 [Rhodothermales bacterium]|jgi:hypothetical protein
MGRLATFASIWAILILPSLCHAQVSEYELKAAYLYNFLRYTTFPDASFANPEDPIEVLVFGSNPFPETVLKKLGTRRCHGRPIRVRICDQVAQIGTPQLVFISAATAVQKREKALRRLANRPLILVGENKAAGAHIVLSLTDRRLRFDVRRPEASASSVRFSSRMLALAREVY